MKELSFEKMERLNGGGWGFDCGLSIIGVAGATAAVIASDGLALLLNGVGYWASIMSLHVCLD